MRTTVVGSGVVGLTTAITLQRAGWQVRVLSAAPIEALTSHLAAAVWFPTTPTNRMPSFVGEHARSRCWRACASERARAWTADCILGGTLDENRWDTEVDLAAAARA